MVKVTGTGPDILEHQRSSVIMRFPDSVSFESGSDQPVAPFINLIRRIRTILQEPPGRIIVDGHTDDRLHRNRRLEIRIDFPESPCHPPRHAVFKTDSVTQTH